MKCCAIERRRFFEVRGEEVQTNMKLRVVTVAVMAMAPGATVGAAAGFFVDFGQSLQSVRLTTDTTWTQVGALLGTAVAVVVILAWLMKRRVL